MKNRNKTKSKQAVSRYAKKEKKNRGINSDQVPSPEEMKKILNEMFRDWKNNE